MAIKDLDLDQIHHPLLNACHSLASTLHDRVTWHSTQLRLVQLIERFPRLKPFLIILNKYGLHLKDILSGENNGLDIFVDDDDDEIGETFQQVKFLRSLLTDLHYADSDPIQLANAQQTFNTHIINQSNFSIIYDETIDLYDRNQDLTNALIDLHRLLVPNGLLLLLELVHVPLYFDLIFGFFDQWWSSDDNNLSIIFAWQLDQTSLDENNDELAFKQNEELICGTLSRILQIIKKSSPYFYPFVYILTDHAQFNNDSNLNIIPSPFIGLARSLITEYERHRLQLIDLQTSLNNRLIFIHTLIEYMIDSRYSNDTCDVVLRLNHANQNQVQHLTWHYEMLQNNDEQEKSKLEQISIIPKRDADQKPFRPCVPQSRFLSELTWNEEDREKELLPAGMVEVRVHCVGISFRDVLKSRGLYPHTRTFAQSDENQPKVNRDTEPGSDFVGTIVRVGPTTTNFQVGDHVVGATSHGTYHSHIMINSQLIIRIPSDFPLTDEQLCGMPTPLLTVIYSLKYRVHLQAGQTVLIHAATGAAGQWCIQYCQYIGARVIATAGTEEKRRFLHEYYGIEHVFNSRDTSFVNNIREILPQGVDVIVNSLSGNLLKESIKLLAYHGNFVEWGKRDIYHNGNLSMFQLRSDCSFHVIDFAGLLDHISPLIGIMLKEAIDLFIQRKLRAVEPTVTYEPSQVIEALLRCNSGQVMGKTVFRISSSDQPLTINKKQSNSLLKVVSDNTMFPSEVCNQGTILISGGFGGLGLTMSRWMIEQRGVKHIALVSRRTLTELEKPSNPQYDEWLRLKRTTKEYNAHVDVVQADVTNFQQVHDLIEKFSKTSNPLRGIIHSAIVAEDRALNNLTQDHLSLVLPPKVRGA
ncbi:unnamed protein product [Adineta steineri]|uniref:Enoyl reductase (ER) domain-containing protein n=1 Tax=Adineta steineri TaxID=433720 RepID=A0A815P5Q0_9BILA|nr:unnamed protein product [Adineta steineri]CAF1444492.1 unnamed protein product [Adineta steineri]